MFNEPHLAARTANLQPLTPLEYLARTLELSADRPAVAWREYQWTYRDFGDLVARMVEWLRAQGVGRGDVVSVMLTNRPEMLAAHYAVPALGAVLNALNIRLSTEEVGYILDHSGARLLICESPTAPCLPGATIPVFQLVDGPEGDVGLNFFHGPVTELDLTAEVTEESQPIALNYTSGTTGKPKGVVYTHRGAALNALGNVLALGLNHDSRYLWTLPMFHCNGWCHTWAVVAASGLNICLDRVEPKLILDTISARSVTHMCCAPVVLYVLLEHATEDMSVDIKVATGGAPPTPALLSGLGERGFELVHLYGLTESYGPATLNDPWGKAFDNLEAKAEYLARQGQRHILAGRARVLDESGVDVPADGNTVGEIILRGNTVMAGYYRDPEATEDAFRGGGFHTGDLAVVHSDGQIEIRDRAKDVIITGGENVSSLEIENVLHKHPDVFLAAVVAVQDPKWGETPWAFVELKERRELLADDLDAFCRIHLAGFKRPRGFVFGELPKTATGKIQKFILREQAKEGVEK